MSASNPATGMCYEVIFEQRTSNTSRNRFATRGRMKQGSRSRHAPINAIVGHDQPPMKITDARPDKITYHEPYNPNTNNPHRRAQGKMILSPTPESLPKNAFSAAAGAPSSDEMPRPRAAPSGGTR